jgi:L-fuconolactonase
MKGFRHVLQGEAQRDFMLRPAFQNGISLLQRYGFTYDILIYPDQLPFIPYVCCGFPGTEIHYRPYGKALYPRQKNSGMESLHAGLGSLRTGVLQNIWPGDGSRLEAMDKSRFYPYLDVVVQAFGIDRIGVWIGLARMPCCRTVRGGTAGSNGLFFFLYAKRTGKIFWR